MSAVVKRLWNSARVMKERNAARAGSVVGPSPTARNSRSPTVLAGLPKAARVVGPWSQVRLKCEDFFARHGIGANV